MKIIYYFAIGFVLASAGVSQRAFAQTYDRTYARSLILPGGGTDAIDNLTITLHSTTTGGITWTLPATNINGLFLNDGAGNISWATTLPSGLTIPSPIFTGTISFTAGSIPVADLASNTTALTSSGNTLTFSGGNGSGAVALGGTAGNYDLNLAHANTWTGVQTHSNTTTTGVAPLVASNTGTIGAGVIGYGAMISCTGASTGIGNVGLQLDASGNTTVGGYNVALYAHTGTINVQGLSANDVVMTDANRNLISAGTATTVPPNFVLAGPATGSTNGAATFRALTSADITGAAAGVLYNTTSAQATANKSNYLFNVGYNGSGSGSYPGALITTTSGGSSGATGLTVVANGNGNKSTGILVSTTGSTTNNAIAVTAGDIGISSGVNVKDSALSASDVVMTDASKDLISAGSSTTVPAHDFLLGPIGSSNGAATFRAIDSSDISSAAAAKIAAKLAATPGSGVANVATAVTGVVNVNSTGATVLAGDSIHIPANATISFQFIMIDSQNYGGTKGNPGDGIKFGLNWPSGATVWAEAVGTEDNAANGHEHAEHLKISGTLTTNNFLDQQDPNGGTNNAATGTIQIIGTIVNGSTAGTLQVIWGTSNTATIGYIFPYAQITAYTH